MWHIEVRWPIANDLIRRVTSSLPERIFSDANLTISLVLLNMHWLFVHPHVFGDNPVNFYDYIFKNAETPFFPSHPVIALIHSPIPTVSRPHDHAR